MTRSHNPTVYGFDIDHGTSDAPPPPRKQSNAQQLAPGYLWNSTTQELIPILPEDHPDYRENADHQGSISSLGKRDIKMTDQLKRRTSLAPNQHRQKDGKPESREGR